MSRQPDPARVRRAKRKTAHFAAKAKQKAYEKRRAQWRLEHPLVEAKPWTAPLGHPRYGEEARE